MKGLPGGWVVYMGVTVATFLVLGCLLEGLPAIVLLAPLFCMGLFHATRKRLIVSWCALTGIVTDSSGAAVPAAVPGSP